MKKFLIILVLFLLYCLSGCSLLEISKQTTLADNYGTIKGEIHVVSDQEGPIIVLRFLVENGIPVLQRTVTASENGEYQFTALPGKYYIAAFIDANRDGKYQPEEHGNYYGEPTTVDLGEKHDDVTVEPITITGPVPKPATEIKPIDRRLAVWKNIGRIVQLDDQRFSLENYSMGLWKPFDFLDKAEGGLFFLEPYQENKIPVLFVHGVVNGPTLWTKVIEKLDRDRFQPWLFYYPSGLRLDMISDYLVEAVTSLQEEYEIKQIYLVAHSMGGLVARSFVKKYVARDSKNAEILRLAITVNSPMNGMAAAGAGVRHSPIVVPSWRDVMPGSEFLQGINSWHWPKKIPYHLIISYMDGKSDDGVVPLQSQAQQKLQNEATRIYLFNSEHSAIIDKEQFHITLNQILENTGTVHFSLSTDMNEQ